jgi:hypothetical protein
LPGAPPRFKKCLHIFKTYVHYLNTPYTWKYSSASRGEPLDPHQVFALDPLGDSREPSDIPFRKSWIRHCDFLIYPYVGCLCSIPKVKPTILWWWVGGWGSTSFATFFLYTSSLSLHRILYIPGGFWKCTPPLTNIGPTLTPSLKTKSWLSSPFESQTKWHRTPLWKIPGSAPVYNRNINNFYPENLWFLSSLYTLASI